ncbi:hypothetical protein B0S90_1096 [Caldicellulosiruptor bescii]|uniref:Rhomboid family protein n=1 Tax=Caldicellulosiruptor bescii TaxID=31899 RepID=A0ABY1SAF7_CALBS|nr:hypothetical protein B0S87_0224 [Caldicellulosiruptor bescii]PBC90267.1 hypothetical protein B0S89_0598 [Caldicellulosiruptor bescii]PBD04305.1 hypothetical protein B0S85_1951 [Caldicellulosiruptor bescii]PBD06064.1 hypothetical protein B0S90_1096 [Caldicellulosiruptor bescii]PBD08936.1 hypothetical protein B0S84_1306 [Caldicellulosiruptor bescii]
MHMYHIFGAVFGSLFLNSLFLGDQMNSQKRRDQNGSCMGKTL